MCEPERWAARFRTPFTWASAHSLHTFWAHYLISFSFVRLARARTSCSFFFSCSIYTIWNMFVQSKLKLKVAFGAWNLIHNLRCKTVWNGELRTQTAEPIWLIFSNTEKEGVESVFQTDDITAAIRNRPIIIITMCCMVRAEKKTKKSICVLGFVGFFKKKTFFFSWALDYERLTNSICDRKKTRAKTARKTQSR